MLRQRSLFDIPSHSVTHKEHGCNVSMLHKEMVQAHDEFPASHCFVDVRVFLINETIKNEPWQELLKHH